MYQIEKVILCLNKSWELSEFLKKFQKENIEVAVLNTKMSKEDNNIFKRQNHCIVLTDLSRICKELLEKGIPVLALQAKGENSSDEDFWGIPYIAQSLCDIDVMYLDRIYRRFKKIPWDILETNRCIIREITVDDVPRIAEIYQAPSVKKYMEPLYEPIEKEVAYVEDYIKNIYGFYEYGTWIIVEKSSGRIIGRAGLENYGSTTEEETEADIEACMAEDDKVEMGYLIDDAYQRHGYAYEVCSAILQYAKKELGITTVWTRTSEDNKASIELCRKLGFSYVRKCENDMLLFQVSIK